MDAREMAGKKEERLSKDPHCCKYQDQRNTRFLEVTDEKVHDGKNYANKLIEHILKRNNNDIKIESALG